MKNHEPNNLFLFLFMPPFIIAAIYSVWVTIAGIITISTGYAVWPCY